jgi:AcrR family transcriptional regulator
MDAFLDVAMDIVVREGQDALTMAGIAAGGDAAVGAVYRYFPGKDAILAGLQIRAISAFDAFLEARLSMSDPLDRVRTVIHAWPAFAEAEPQRYALADRSLSDPRENLTHEAATEVEAALAPVIARVSAVLREAAEAGALTPGDATSRTMVLWASVHGATHFRKRDRVVTADRQFERLLMSLEDTLLTAWGRRRS